VNELEQQYLRAAYDLAMQDPQRMFNEDEIANHLDLDASQPNYADRFINISADLLSRGYIAPVSIGSGMGRRKLRLTAAGIDEARKLRDPIEERKELRRDFLRTVYEQANGSPTEFVYWPDLAPRYGYADSEIPPRSIMGAIDQLAASGFITIEVDEGVIYRITAKGIDEVEGSMPGYDRRPKFVSGSSLKIAPQPFIDSTPDEFSNSSPVGQAPVEIQGSLKRFRADYPDPDKVAFIMMQFGQTRAHAEITEAVRDCLADYGIVGVRADGKRYHDNLFYNVLTYLHGCGMGIAIYEGIDTQANNPNVALEVGYLFAMRKPVCHLKDQTLSTLPSDLVGQLYDPFDTYDPAKTIPPVLSRWISDKGLA
jgi:hypothetical protein